SPNPLPILRDGEGAFCWCRRADSADPQCWSITGGEMGACAPASVHPPLIPRGGSGGVATIFSGGRRSVLPLAIPRDGEGVGGRGFMAARTGKEYLAGLRDGREVWLDGE